MIGAIKFKDVSEKIICIDSSGGMDQTSSNLFNLVIPGPCSALSIGMFTTNFETKKPIRISLELLKSIWNEHGISNYRPLYFMSDDCAAQIQAINESF